MLRVENLHFEYDSGVQVLKEISFKVKAGELCGLFGPNGCGKTTLFKCCLNFLKFSKGDVLLDGSNLKDISIAEMAKIASYVPQEHKPAFTYLVRDVVLMGRTPYIQDSFRISNEHKTKALEALELVGILDLADKPYNNLSGGQRQLVLIARAVAQNTKLMFLDEPTSALDFSNQIKVWNILRKISKEGTTIIACTHDPNHVMWFCDKVVVMNNHDILVEGNPKEVITEELLDKIYKNICRVENLNGFKMIYPKDLKK